MRWSPAVAAGLVAILLAYDLARAGWRVAQNAESPAPGHGMLFGAGVLIATMLIIVVTGTIWYIRSQRNE